MSFHHILTQLRRHSHWKPKIAVMLCFQPSLKLLNAYSTLTVSFTDMLQRSHVLAVSAWKKDMSAQSLILNAVL